MNIFQAEKILPSDQKKVIERGKFTYSPLRKTLKKQTKIIKDQKENKQKQLKSIENNWLSLMDLLKIDYDSKEGYETLLKQKEIFDKINSIKGWIKQKV